MKEVPPQPPEEPVEPEKELQPETPTATEAAPAGTGRENRPERGPVSYEQALEAARNLRAMKVEDPYITNQHDEDSPNSKSKILLKPGRKEAISRWLADTRRKKRPTWPAI